MNEDALKELKESAEDVEIVESNIEELLKRKFLEYSQMSKTNSTKKGNNPKAIKARRKKNKNKKTHRR